MVGALCSCGGSGHALKAKPVPTLPPGHVKIPNLVGDRAEAACTLVTSVGLECGPSEMKASNNVPLGDVMGSNPPAGQVVASGSQISFVVSGDDVSVLVPNVVGDTGESAASTLGSLDLTVTKTCQVAVSPTQDGIVVSEEPEAGGAVSVGSIVTISITQLSC